MKPLCSMLLAVLACIIFATAPAAEETAAAALPTEIEIVTNRGTLEARLFADKAPRTVRNFLDYVESGFYDGTIFHRVIPGFMIQGGGFTVDMDRKPTGEPVVNEADNGLKNERGTLAMARTSDPNSATAQFFINSVDNEFLDHTGKTPRGWGYTVFGRVTEGLDVIDTISSTPTTRVRGMADLPVDPVVIESIRVTSQDGD